MNHNAEKLQIQIADLSALYSIIEIMNKVTLHLHDQGINQWDYPCETAPIESDILEKSVYLVLLDQKPVGTFSIKSTTLLNSTVIEPENLYLYRIALLPEVQGQHLSRQIIQFACNRAHSTKMTLYLDCWAGNQKLIDFYTKAGFKSLGIFPEEDYSIHIFMCSSEIGVAIKETGLSISLEYLKNFTRCGLIIGLLISIYFFANGLLEGKISIATSKTEYEGFRALFIIFVFIPVGMALNGLVWGLISYFPYLLVRKITGLLFFKAK
ncbi:N-acetyltransferase [Fusibacter sp. 3D3]|uniref:GNAT family N-acetyltransferase n=1 Tax=Fusibacter sp. 3D3 TaxID=1048380 RepID=UPI0008534212|nr:GNAT family N-acetyltransferase [Fusibacter sp. 3D3]GAU78458.1 hypothetical protein F3D3_3092 [Fusibacter sp. 3D3]